jgi:hypothetical protein
MRSSLLGWLFLGGIITLQRLYGTQPTRQQAHQTGEAIPAYELDPIERGWQREAAIPQN